jgi:hypothetical protein
MAWTAPATVTTGELMTAAFWNTQIRDNLLESAAAKVTTAGDTLYATGANTLARLAKGTAGQVLKMNAGATAPEWGSNAPTFAQLPSVYAAHVYRSSAQTISNGSATVVSWDSELYDLQAMHDPSTNPSRITVPVTGFAVISAGVLWSSNTTGIRILEILHSGVARAETRRLPNSGMQTWHDIQVHLEVGAGQYFEVRVTQDSGGNLDLVGGQKNTWFAVAILPGPW